MFRAIHIGGLLFLAALGLYGSPVEEHILVLFVTDTAQEQVSNITITCNGDCSQANAVQGKVRLKLPPQTRPGEWVTLQVIKRASGTDWVMISPWDSRVIVPSFENKADNAVPIVVARKGDKQILSSSKAIETLVARVLKEVVPKLDKQISDEERRLVLKLQAEVVGLTPEEVDRAIREWGNKAQDLYQQGLAALYEKNYPESTKLLTQSYQVRKETTQKAVTEYADVTFFLGRSLYEQVKYRESVEKFREAISLRKDDASLMNWFGLSLYKAGKYVEAEPYLKRALEIREKTLGREHADTAQSLNTLADFYATQERNVEAEPLFKRAIEIREKALGKEAPETAQSLSGL